MTWIVLKVVVMGLEVAETLAGAFHETAVPLLRLGAQRQLRALVYRLAALGVSHHLCRRGGALGEAACKRIHRDTPMASLPWSGTQ